MMKFCDLDVGAWFKTTKNPQLQYIKISPAIEDKYGNNFIAVDNRGYAIDSEEIPPDSDVIIIKKE